MKMGKSEKWKKVKSEKLKEVDFKNLILEHSHPSPLSRKPFVGNNHFVLCNDYLKSKNTPIIQWV